MHHEPPPGPTNFARLLAEGAEPARIAAVSVSAWQDIEGSLAPIIGLRGVAALYKRSLYLARGEFPWLAAVYEGALGPSEFSSLAAVLSRQSSAEAIAGSAALLTTFNNLLTSLIGRSLSERLLRSDLDLLSSDPAEQDPSP
jgi:hypothetical protein